MPAITNFLKSNAKFAYGGGLLLGGLGAAFTAGDFNKRMKEGDGAMKALLKTFKDFLLVKVALAGTFTAVGAAVKALVKDTGSLDAALKRLSEVQRFQKIFTPLVGGAREARNHVASLLNFAANTPFKFESIAQADKNLRTFTRGAFAGTGALKVIGDAAATSGNGIAESAQAVGNFYDTLHNGQPVRQAVEELRQMGLVSGTAAEHLQRLADSGSSSIDMANNLTSALAESRGGMQSYAKDLEAISDAHDKAAESAKAAFGQAFVKPEASSIQNYTKALVAITPALEDSGKFLAGWFNTLTGIGSKITKFAAETGVLGGAIRVLSALLVGGGAALTVLGLAAIPVIGPFLALAAGIAFVGSALYKFSRISKDAAKELEQLSKAHREAQADIDAHAASIQDVTDLQEQYGRSIQHIIDLQNELNAAVKKGDKGKIEEISRAIKEARAKMSALPGPEQLASKERGNVISERLEERRMRERSRVDEGIRAHPGEATERNQQRAAQLEQRAEAARQGLQTRQKVAEAQSGQLQRQSDLKLDIASLEAKRQSGSITKEEGEQLRQSKTELAVIQGKLLETQEKMGQGASVGLEAQSQRLEHAQRANSLEKAAADVAGTKEEKQLRAEAARERMAAGGVKAGPNAGREAQDLKAKAAELAGFENQIPEIAEEARRRREDAMGQSRERAVGKIELGSESGAAGALLSGDTKSRERFQDMGSFVQKFEQLRSTFGDDQARQMAIQGRANELIEQLPMNIKPVADSLTRIGGGGGVSGPTGDPMQRVQERIRDLTVDSLDVLKHIDEAVSGAGTPEVGGGAGNPALELPPGAPGTPESTSAPSQLNPPPNEAMVPTPVTGGTSPDWTTGVGHIQSPGGPSGAPTPSSSVVPSSVFQQLGDISQPSFPSPIPSITPMPSVSVTPMPTPPPNATPSHGYDMIGVLKDIHRSNEQSNEHLETMSTKDSGVF